MLFNGTCCNLTDGNCWFEISVHFIELNLDVVAPWSLSESLSNSSNWKGSVWIYSVDVFYDTVNSSQKKLNRLLRLLWHCALRTICGCHFFKIVVFFDFGNCWFEISVYFIELNLDVVAPWRRVPYQFSSRAFKFIFKRKVAVFVNNRYVYCRDSCQFGSNAVNLYSGFPIKWKFPPVFRTQVIYSIKWCFCSWLFRQSTQLVWLQLSFHLSLSFITARSKIPIQTQRCALGEQSVC